MCIITVKTQTAALRGKMALEASGIAADVVGLDSTLTQKGCAYGISLDCKSASRAEGILRSRQIPYGTVVGRAKG